MSIIELDTLLAPVSDDSPCGPDLRGDPEFRDIEDAPAGFSSLKPPELLKTVRTCTDLLARSKDQMPAIVGVQAALRAGDVSTATTLLAFITRIADEHWEIFHPGPAEDMAIGRVNELSALSRPAAMLLPLQRLAMATMPPPATTEFTAAVVGMANDPVKEWTSEDDERLNAQVASGAVTSAVARAMRPNQEAARQMRSFMVLLSEAERQRDVDADTLVSGTDAGALPIAIKLRHDIVARRAQLQALSDQIYTLGEVFERKMGDPPSLGPVLSQLRSMIEVAGTFLDRFPDPDSAAEAPAEAAGDAPPAADGVSANRAAAAPAARAHSFDVPRHRQDVQIAIDSIIRYYTEKEPTSPVPLMLQRVRKWVDLDFYKLMKDISPDSMSEVRRLLAITDD
ncbi:MAG: type VI secretion system ImpA family N-terminal domain-containing protein [Sphingomonadales bacterium]